MSQGDTTNELFTPKLDKTVIISLGAGVQSSTMALMAADGLITPMPHCAIFADTQREPRAVYDWLAWLETQLPFPVYRVTAGDLGKRELTVKLSKTSGKRYRSTAIPAFGLVNGKPGILGRKCTRDFKIRPIIKQVRAVANIRRGQKEVTVEQWIGISWDEMVRMKDSGEPWIKHRWPLIEKEMTRLHCIEWMRERFDATPPRSACTFCPFHSDEEWRNVRAVPDEWAKVIQFEKDMQAAANDDEVLRVVPYLHKSCVPIGEADIEDKHKDQGAFSFLDECDGMCGV